MGRFSSTVHVKINTDKSKFKDSFCDVMEKRGFEPCSENEAALSYLIAFSEGGWVTLSSDGYSDSSNQAHDDVRQIAEKIKTSGFSVEVVDSDFAILKLFGKKTDEVIIGDGSSYGIENSSNGSKNCWESLLSENKTWEQLSEAWTKEEVFVEDALWKSASILGIEPKYMSADYRELYDDAMSSKNIFLLYFKKAKDRKKGKSISLNAAFIKIFGEGLEPLGFKRLKNIKNKQPYYVRVINNEILHIITYRPVKSQKNGYKAIEVLGGAVTLYRKNIDFIYFTNDTARYLMTANDFYRSEYFFKTAFNLYIESNVINDAIQFWCNLWGRNKDEVVKNDVWGRKKEQIPNHETTIDAAFRRSCIDFLCKSDDSEEILVGIENAFNVTKSIIVAVLDKVTNLKTCADYFFKGYIKSNVNLSPLDEFIANDSYSVSEGLMLIKAKYRACDKKTMEDDIAQRIHWMGRTTQEDVARIRKEYEEYYLKQTALRCEMLDCPEMNQRVMLELERCKAKNIATLKSYGIL